MSHNLEQFIKKKSNCNYGITFGRELQKNLDKRFPNGGTNIMENCVANYLDPHHKGIHLIKFRQMEETKDFLIKQTEDAENALNESLQSEGEMSPSSKLKQQLKKKSDVFESKIEKKMNR